MLITMPAVLLALAACEKEPGEKTLPESGTVVSFVLGGDSVVSKSTGGTQVASYAIEDVDEAEGLALVETVSSMDEMFAPAEVGTKGAPVYNENFDDIYGAQLYATAYEPKTGSAQKFTDVWGSYLENGGTVKLEKATEDLTYYYDYSKGQATNLSWPDGGNLMYFLQAPYDKTKRLSPEFWSDGSIRFDYTDPAYVSGTSITNAAASQTDVLFASKAISKSESTNSILMYHALTGVKFQLGNVDSEGVKTSITKVTIKDIASKGHCTITPADGSKSSACSVWSGLSQEVTYSQEFSGVVDYAKGDGSNFADSFYDDKNNLKNLGKKDGSEILMMVPQVLDKVELVVDFTIQKGIETPIAYQRSVKLSSTWLAGELHTYKLTVNKVEVSVDDEMNEARTQKSNVVVSNDGNVPAYLRLACSVAWFYEPAEGSPIAVAAWQGRGEFKTDGKEGLSTVWVKGEDGFYYYPYPVNPGKSAKHALFDTFTVPQESTEAPFPEGYLDMMLLLQGVQYDADMAKVKEAWGTVKTADGAGLVVDKLKKTPESAD